MMGPLVEKAKALYGKITVYGSNGHKSFEIYRKNGLYQLYPRYLDKLKTPAKVLTQKPESKRT